MPGAAAPTRLRARALYCASVLADVQADHTRPRGSVERPAASIGSSTIRQGIATTMTVMAFQAQRQGRYAEATSLFGETVSLWEQLGDVTAVDFATSNMANAAKTGGNFDLARSLLEQVVASSQARGDVRGFAFALNGLGDVAASQGNHDSARRYHHQSLARYREIDDRWGIARVLADLASVDLQAGEYAAADGLSGRRSRRFARWAISAASRVSWSRCPGAPAASHATKRRSCWRAPQRQSARRSGHRPSRPSGKRSSARWPRRECASVLRRTPSAWREGLTATLDRILGIETAPRA